MANFKVGQRVRVVKTHMHSIPWLIGKEGTILRATTEHGGWGPAEWAVRVDGTPWDYMLFLSCHLAPLTDPKADEFIEKLKKLGNEPQPVPVGDEQPALREVLDYYRTR